MPIYNEFKTQILNGVYDLTNDDIKCNLFETLTINVDETGYPPAVGTEVTSPNYPDPAFNNILQGAVVDQDNANDRGRFDAEDYTWSNVTFSPRYFVLYDDTPTSPADPFIAAFDFGAAQPVNDGTFTIQWDDPNGIVTIT